MLYVDTVSRSGFHDPRSLILQRGYHLSSNLDVRMTEPPKPAGPWGVPKVECSDGIQCSALDRQIGRLHMGQSISESFDQIEAMLAKES